MELNNKNTKIIGFDSFNPFVISEENEKKITTSEMIVEEDEDKGEDTPDKMRLNPYIRSITAIKNELIGQLTECDARIIGKNNLGGAESAKKYKKTFLNLLERAASLLGEATNEREKGRKTKDKKLIATLQSGLKELTDDLKKANEGYNNDKNTEIEQIQKNIKYKGVSEPIGSAIKAFREAYELMQEYIDKNQIMGKDSSTGSNTTGTTSSKEDITIDKPIKQWVSGEGNSTVKKVQQLIYDKFNKVKGVGDTQLFKAFSGSKKFPDGKNGKITSQLIVLLKKGFGLKDTTPDITKEFVTELTAMKESKSEKTSNLLTFESFLSSKVKVNEEFKVDDFTSAYKEYKVKKATTTTDKSDKASSKEESTGFTKKEEGDAFRKWVNNKHADWAKENKLDATGSYDNSYIRKAWAKFKDEYKKSI